MSNRFVPPRTTGEVVDPQAVSNAAYEFSANDNETFSSLAKMMKFVAVVSSLLGVLQIIGGAISGHVQGMVQVGQGVVLVVIGGWLFSASGALNDVAVTEGNDIPNLMYAMKKLKNVYTLQAWLLGLACAFIVFAIVYVMMMRH